MSLKTFYKNPSPDINSVINRTSSQDTREGEFDPASSGPATAEQESSQQESSQQECLSGGSGTGTTSEATATQEPIPNQANTEVKVEKQSSNTKLVDRGHGHGEESEDINASIGGEGGGRPTLESNGDRRQDDELLTCRPKPPIPVQDTGGDAMIAGCVEQTLEGIVQ